MKGLSGFWREIWAFRQTMVVILTPLLLLPLPLTLPGQEYKAAYGLLIMAVYWVTETIPLPVTALLPMVIFPLLGVADAREISREYLKDSNMLFVGGFMMAVAVEKWNLHKRIALHVLLLVGSEPKWLMLGFMIPSAFLSMWISNTATTAMMVPIARAVVEQLIASRRNNLREIPDKTDENPTGRELKIIHPETSQVCFTKNKVFLPVRDTDKAAVPENRANSYDVTSARTTRMSETEFDNIRKGMTLCVAYAATCGGVATLTGTGTNLVFKGQIDSLFNHEAGINYTSWFIFAFPCSVLSLFVCYIWLQIYFLGIRNSIFRCKATSENFQMQSTATRAILRKELKSLGSMSFAEVMVALHFLALALLWLTRESDFFTGWGSIVSGRFVSDSTPAILLAISLFVFPSSRPNFLYFRAKNDTSDPGPKKALLDWDTVTQRFSWSILLLLGGGYALALACQKSGLSQLLANELTVFKDIPPWSLCVIITTMIAGITEVTSNVAIATIFLPILAQLSSICCESNMLPYRARRLDFIWLFIIFTIVFLDSGRVSIGIGVHPLYLMIPGCMATSFAFMLPVATPPNAIVFSYGYVRVLDMAKAGLALNIICIAIVNLAINTWGFAYFKLNEFPNWANATHSAAVQDQVCGNVTLQSSV